MSARVTAVIFLSVCTLSCATYRPAPLEPAETAHEFAARKLAGRDLCRYLTANLASPLPTCPPARWELPSLTLAAFFYSPDFAVAEAQLKVAEATIITAGQRPNPTIGIGPAYTASGAPALAPWAIGAAELNFPIETAGKRNYRIAEAERLADASALEVGETAWRVRGAVRTALLNRLLAQREYDLAQAYQFASERTAQVLQERLSTGASSAPTLNLALVNAATARVKAVQARSRLDENLNALGEALGVPVDSLAGITLVWPELDHPPDEAFLTAGRVRQLALLNRIDLRRMLAEYAATDDALKLEIARQYPDVYVGGGYSWEVGENLFQLLPIISLPLMNQNQGPVAEARAKRTEVAAKFTQLQDSIIAQANSALTRYRGALEAYLQASSSAAFSEKRLAAIKRSAELGDSDALALATAQLETVVAEQSQLTALGSAQTALGALEDAVERPLEDSDLKSFSFSPPLRNAADRQQS
jgi:outer membrane protein, heavy metal efflux system